MRTHNRGITCERGQGVVFVTIVELFPHQHTTHTAQNFPTELFWDENGKRWDFYKRYYIYSSILPGVQLFYYNFGSSTSSVVACADHLYRNHIHSSHSHSNHLYSDHLYSNHLYSNHFYRNHSHSNRSHSNNFHRNRLYCNCLSIDL